MGPFAVAANGQSVQTATGPQSLLTASKPLSKLDTTNIVSFQTISILFNNEPPQPTTSVPITDTLLYQFAHGYTYIPDVWMIWQNPAPAYPASPPAGGTATTFNAFGDETASGNIISSATQLSIYADVAYNDPGYGFVGNFSDAFLYLIVDNTNVSIYMRKIANLETSASTVIPVFVIGTTVNIRIYAFVEPGTTSTY